MDRRLELVSVVSQIGVEVEHQVELVEDPQNERSLDEVQWVQR